MEPWLLPIRPQLQRSLSSSPFVARGDAIGGLPANGVRCASHCGENVVERVVPSDVTL